MSEKRPPMLSGWAIKAAKKKSEIICRDCPVHHISTPHAWFACRKCTTKSIAEALMEERERCARIAEAVYSGDEGTNSYLYDEGPKIAEAIRKGSVK